MGDSDLLAFSLEACLLFEQQVLWSTASDLRSLHQDEDGLELELEQNCWSQDDRGLKHQPLDDEQILLDSLWDCMVCRSESLRLQPFPPVSYSKAFFCRMKASVHSTWPNQANYHWPRDVCRSCMLSAQCKKRDEKVCASFSGTKGMDKCRSLMLCQDSHGHGASSTEHYDIRRDDSRFDVFRNRSMHGT